jgi:hypothetical protein
MIHRARELISLSHTIVFFCRSYLYNACYFVLIWEEWVFGLTFKMLLFLKKPNQMAMLFLGSFRKTVFL